jgi:phosphatidylglycerophosphate synthase
MNLRPVTLLEPPPPPTGDLAAARVREIQDPLNRYLYHPLAARLAGLLQPTGITPNAVSAFSGGLICATAACYWAGGFGWLLTGFGCHLLWHVADGADGDLARLTGKSSPIGEFIDGAADYLGHVVLYVVLAAILDDAIGVWAWLLAIASGASRIVQSNHAESQRRTYLWRVYGTGWLKTEQDAGNAVFSGRSWFSRNSARVAKGYVALAAWLSPSAARIDALFAAAAGAPPRAAELRRIVREVSGGSLLLQKLLGANSRTIVLGFSMLAGSSVWFFLFETLLLNSLLALSLFYHNVLERRLLGSLANA